MFRVKPHNHLPDGIKLVASGTMLGRWDVPMTFELTSDIVPEPFFINLVVTKGDKGDEGRLEFGPITGNQVTATLKVKPTGLPIGTISRPSILGIQEPPLQLTISFILHAFSDSEFFGFTYEFYEEPPQPPTQPPQGEAQT